MPLCIPILLTTFAVIQAVCKVIVITSTVVALVAVVSRAGQTEQPESESSNPRDTVPAHPVNRTLLAALGEFPHHVSIQADGEHACSGTLLCKNHVLTSAQCVDDLLDRGSSMEDIKVAVGTITSFNGSLHQVDKMTLHQSFDPDTLKNDVAVIRLKNGVTFSNFVSKIKLPNETHALKEGQVLNATAFTELDKLEYYLQKFTATVLLSIPKKSFPPGRNFDGKFATVSAPGQISYCLEEFGTPLTVNNEYILGIHSERHTEGCYKDTPELFSYVPHYLGFIKSQMKN